MTLSLLDPSGWQVQRHSGGKSDVWRLVCHGTEGATREQFSALARELRVGAVRLLDPEGLIVRRQVRHPVSATTSRTTGTPGT